MKKDINSTSSFSLDDDTTRIIHDLVEIKFGEKIIRCRQAKHLREAVYNKTHQYISEASIKRFFGLVSYEGGRFRKSTLDLLALYLGYESFSAMQAEIKSRAIDTPLHTLFTSNLEKGSQIKLTFAKGLESLMCYIGDNNFIINRSTMPLFAKGEIYTAECISAGKCLEVAENKLEMVNTGIRTLVTTIRIVL